jgi:hypothetical protein
VTPASPASAAGPTRQATWPGTAGGRSGHREGELAPISVRLQILATEHWSLLATRSLTWTESFSRAQMFLSVLSGAVVALALVAQATSFGAGFVAFALVALPVVLFVGLTTFVRLVAANNDEARWVLGMNRIRAAYLGIAPELEPFFVTGHHDDDRGLMVTTGYADFPTFYGYVTTPAVVGVIDGVVAATIVFLAAGQTGIDAALAASLALATFALWNVAFTRYVAKDRRRLPLVGPAVDPTPASESAGSDERHPLRSPTADIREPRQIGLR